MKASTRRTFLEMCALSAAGALVPTGVVAETKSTPHVKFPSAARDRVAVAAYPFRDYIVGWMGWDGKTPSSIPRPQQIELKDFASHVAEKFSVRHVELWSPVFPSTDSKYLEQLRSAVEKVGSSVVDIAVDQGHSQYATDPEEREKAVTASRQWIDVGLALGSPSIRTHIDSAKDSQPDVKRAAETFAHVAEYAEKTQIVVHLENDNPVSEDPFFIVQILDKVNSPWLRALPDFGNTVAVHDADFAYGAIDAMFAHAYGICHVKPDGVNDDGKVIRVDLERTFGILKKHDFKGYCSMEFDEPGDPYKATAALVEQTVKFLS